MDDLLHRRKLAAQQMAADHEFLKGQRRVSVRANARTSRSSTEPVSDGGVFDSQSHPLASFDHGTPRNSPRAPVSFPDRGVSLD
jgi:hypothetical protein